MNIADHSERNLLQFGDYDALIVGDRTWRNRDLHDQSSRMAGALVNAGLQAGERVLAVLPSSRELMVAATAIWRSGGVFVGIYAGTPANEIERIARHCSATAVVTASDLPAAQIASRVARICIGTGSGHALPAGWSPFDQLIELNRPLEQSTPRSADDVAQLIYTSGSTGIPKAVVQTHGGLGAALRDDVTLQNLFFRFSGLQPPAQDVLLACLPPTAFASLFFKLRLVSNTKLVLLDRFDPATVLAAVETHRVTRLPLVPSLAEALLACDSLGRHDCSSVRELMVSGAYAAPSLLARLESWAGVRPFNIYGLTESGGPIAATAPDSAPGSVGQVLPGAGVRIVDESGADLPNGQVGEIYARTPWMTRGYLDAPDDTSRVYRGGWIHTGDRGSLGSDRSLFYTGRSKEIIIQGGLNVIPTEVVEVVRAVPGVDDCAVIGVPHTFLGEEVVACVVRSRGAEVTEQEILAHCRAEMDERKVPGRVRFVDALPRTPGGKLRSFLLREQLVAEQSAVAETDLVRQLRACDAETRTSRLGQLVEQDLRTVLETQGVAVPAAMSGTTFGELGLDSIGVVQFLNALGAQLGHSLPTTLTFGHPTPAELAAHLSHALGGGPTTTGPTTTEPVPAEPSARPATEAEGVAVIGIGCRLAGGVGSPEQFWDLLATGRDVIRDVPVGRWPGDEAGELSTWRGGFLDQIDQFDAKFFRLGLEAEAMDPQHRLVLEVTWEALEDAGLDPHQLGGSRVGMFLGSSASTYGVPGRVGVASSMAVGHVCHFLDLRGPAVTIDTACSSSLVAVHDAAQSLARHECDTAIVGGVNVIASPGAFGDLSALGVLAPDGRTKSFADGADGFGRGEGCLVIVLKRLSRAKADGDRIRAVIRGSAINHDGRSSSLTAPNPRAQAELIDRALRAAAVSPDEIQYVETHGSGTLLGDPIEVEALSSVFGKRAGAPLSIGSVKTNVGHLEAGAGLAGLVKAVLALEHDELPPSLHFTRPNPHIPWSEIPIRVQAERGPWPGRGARRMAGVSSFGLSGTNAHVVLEQAPSPGTSRTHDPAVAAARPAWVLPISARSPEALQVHATRYADALDTELASASPRDIAYTASCRRAHLDCRLAVVGHGHAEWAARLREFAAGNRAKGLASGTVPARRSQVAFVFPGQGSQWLGMGRGLLSAEPVFLGAIEQCGAAIQEFADWSLLEQLHASADGSRLDDDAVVQPMLFAMQVALTALWRSWGISPDVVVGHSMGEVAAAHVAGALTLRDAARIICVRSRLARGLRGRGKMASIELPSSRVEDELRAYGGKISVAANNGPRTTLVSGESAAVAALVEDLTRREVFCRAIKVNYASHCSQIDPLREDLLQALDGLEPAKAAPRARFLSTAVATDALPRLDASYWWTNMRDPVRFAARIEQLRDEGVRWFVEVSAHPALTAGIREIAGGDGVAIESLRRDEPERDVMLEALGRLFAAGHPVDWRKHYPAGGAVVALPSYPWQHARYWSDERATRTGSRIAPLLHRRMALPHDPDTELCEVDLDLNDPALAYLADRKLNGRVRIPESAILEMAWQAALAIHGARAKLLERVRFDRELDVALAEPRKLILVVRPDGEHARFDVYSRAADAGDETTKHAEGVIQLAGSRATPQRLPELDQIEQRCGPMRSVKDDHERSTEYGPAFQCLVELAVGNQEVLGKLTIPKQIARSFAGHQLHPALFDACVQAARSVAGGDGGTCVITELRELSVYQTGEDASWVYVRAAAPGATAGPAVDIWMLGAEGEVLAQARGVSTVTVVRHSSPAASVPPHGLLHDLAGAPAGERVSVLEAYLRRLIEATGASASADQIESDVPLEALGFDSFRIMAVRSALEEDLRLSVEPRFLSTSSLAGIRDHLLGVLESTGTDREGAASGGENLDLRPTGATSCRATTGQEYFWRLIQLDPDHTAYGQPIVMVIKGSLDRRALQESFEAVVAAHTTYRTTFRDVDGALHQFVLPADEATPFRLELVDRSPLAETEWEGEGKQATAEMLSKGFDIPSGVSIRVRLVALAADRHLLVVLIHHVVSDAFTPLLRDVFELYARRTGSATTPPRPPPLQYIDYADALVRWAESPRGAAQRDYWTEQLRGAPPLVLPFDLPSQEFDARRAAAPAGITPEPMHPPLMVALPDPVREGAARVAREEQTSLYVVYLAALARFYNRIGGIDDLCVETTANHRPGHRALEDVHGLIAAWTVMRIRMGGDPTFRELINRTKQVVADSQQNGFIHDYYKVVPYQVRGAIFNYVPKQPEGADQDLAPGLRGDRIAFSFPRWQRPWVLHLTMFDDAQRGTKLFWTGNQTLFHRESVGKFLDRYIEILAELGDSDDRDPG